MMQSLPSFLNSPLPIFISKQESMAHKYCEDIKDSDFQNLGI